MKRRYRERWMERALRAVTEKSALMKIRNLSSFFLFRYSVRDEVGIRTYIYHNGCDCIYVILLSNYIICFMCAFIYLLSKYVRVYWLYLRVFFLSEYSRVFRGIDFFIFFYSFYRFNETVKERIPRQRRSRPATQWFYTWHSISV